jgi:hypothetical protein
MYWRLPPAVGLVCGDERACFLEQAQAPFAGSDVLGYPAVLDAPQSAIDERGQTLRPPGDALTWESLRPLCQENHAVCLIRQAQIRSFRDRAKNGH